MFEHRLRTMGGDKMAGVYVYYTYEPAIVKREGLGEYECPMR
jgi:hypothetical protein